MGSLLLHHKLFKFSSATLQSAKNPITFSNLSKHLQFFSTSSSSNVVVVVVDEDDVKKKKKNPTPKTVIASTSIAELLNSSIGFSPEQAKALESRLRPIATENLQRIQNAQNVIQFFRNAGFSDTHIKKVVSIRPEVLTSSVEKTLKPKIRAFEDLGLSAPEIGDYISRHVYSLHQNPAKVTAFFSKYFPNKEDVARLTKKNGLPPTWNYGRNFEAQISKFLEHGVSKGNLVRYPELLLMKPQVIEERLQKAYQMGFKYGDNMLVYAVKVINSMNESIWDSKIQVLRSYGWDDIAISTAFHRSPFFLSCSLEKIKRMLKFFMDDLKYKPIKLAVYSKLFNLSLDKTIIPRYDVLKELESRGLLKKKRSLLSVIGRKEVQFQKNFLLGIKDEHPDLFQSYLMRVSRA